MPPEMGELLDAEVERESQEVWPAKSNRGLVVARAVAQYLNYQPGEGNGESQKN